MIQNIYQELLHLKVQEMGENLHISKASLPFEASLKDYKSWRMQALPWFLYDFLSAYNELSKCEIRFLE